MNREKRLPKSIRKYIRKVKAQIRREFGDFKKQQEKINELYGRFRPKEGLVKKGMKEYSKGNEE